MFSVNPRSQCADCRPRASSRRMRGFKITPNQLPGTQHECARTHLTTDITTNAFAFATQPRFVVTYDIRGAVHCSICKREQALANPFLCVSFVPFPRVVIIAVTEPCAPGSVPSSSSSSSCSVHKKTENQHKHQASLLLPQRNASRPPFYCCKR